MTSKFCYNVRLVRNPDCCSLHLPFIKLSLSIVRKCRFQWTCFCSVPDIRTWLVSVRMATLSDQLSC
jgi:hypothetical protein